MASPDSRVKVSGSGDDESGPDRISQLPDDLLVRILVLLPFFEAVRTCVLSVRWRRVWTRLPRLEFADDEAPRSAPAFADLIRAVISGYSTEVSVSDALISVRNETYEFAEAFRIAASAFLVGQRATAKFELFVSLDSVNLEGDDEEEMDELQMPCFPTVTELLLTFPWAALRLPRTGTFDKLTKMYIFGVRLTDNGEGDVSISDVVSWRCPCLQDLELNSMAGLKEFFLLSESALRCRLVRVVDLERLIVVAPNLGEMEVTNCFVLATERTSMCLTAPKLKDLRWEDRCPDEMHAKSLPGELSMLTVSELSFNSLILCDGVQSHFTRIMQLFKRIDILRLKISIAPHGEDHNNLMESTVIPFFGELHLVVHKNAHMFAPTVLNFLNRRSGVTKLSLRISDETEDDDNFITIPSCMSDCDCREEDSNIALQHLEWVDVKKFGGTEEETNLLYSIVGYAKALRKLSIEFSVEIRAPKMFLYFLYQIAPPGCAIDFSGEF